MAARFDKYAMNEDWLRGLKNSHQDKRNFLLQHGTADHIRKIVGAADNVITRASRIKIAMESNPHFPVDMFEHAFKIPRLRPFVAQDPNAPDHIHQAALKHESADVRRAAIHSDKTTYAQAEHAAKHDEDVTVQDAARTRISWDGSKVRRLREHNEPKPAISESKKSYIDFSKEIGTSDLTQKLSENVALNEGNKENFAAQYGTGHDLHALIDQKDHLAVSKSVRNPAFTRAHHEQLMNHSDEVMRFYSVMSPHVTTSDLDRLAQDPSGHVRAVAINKIHGLDYLGRPLSESKESFLARHGNADHIAHAIVHAPGDEYDEGDSTYFNAILNRHYSPEHHAMLMQHKDGSARWCAAASIHASTEDLRHLSVHDSNLDVRDKAQQELWLRKSLPHRYDGAGRLKPEYHDLVRGGELPKDALVEKKSYTGFLIEHGLRDVDARESHGTYSVYPLELDGSIKRIYVPKDNIIAPAKETNEGLAAMGCVFEDADQKNWTTLDLAQHLMLSGGVHDHYEDAGVNSYPYRGKNGRVSMERINAVHKFNFHSRPVNDFLHRNYHGLQKSWDAGHHEHVGSLDPIFHERVTGAALNVVSGLKQSPQTIIDHARSQGHDTGEHIHLHLPAYTSTTTRMGTALAFTKAHPQPGKTFDEAPSDVHLLHVHVPAGHRLVGLETHPDLENGSENEIVMPRDTIVRVNTTPSVYRMGHRNINVWMSHVVGSNPVPLKPLPNV